MPIRTRLTTKGFDAYLQKLAEAGANIDAVTDEALAAGGEVLAKGMQSRAPVLTGNLRDNLAASAPKADGNLHFIEVGLKKEADGDTHRYALAQEYGWADRTGAKAGKPYIRPTLDADMGKARTAMRNVFKSRGAL